MEEYCAIFCECESCKNHLSIVETENEDDARTATVNLYSAGCPACGEKHLDIWREYPVERIPRRTAFRADKLPRP